MLEYVEIRSSATRELVGIIDSAKSIIWEPHYNGSGFVEIYAPASALNVAMLQKGNYITRTDDPNVGIIEDIEVSYNVLDGRMVIATGRFAKSILDRRIIYALRKAGKNRFPQIETQTKNGVTFTANANGTVRVTGTPTEQKVAISQIKVLNAGTYTLSAAGASANAFVKITYKAGKEDKEVIVNTSSGSQKFTLGTTTSCNLSIDCGDDTTTARNATLSIQLELGSVKTAFEAYKGGGSGYAVTPTILRGNVENAVRGLVRNNAINCDFDEGRNIPELELGASAGTTEIIVDENGDATEKQVTHDNLLNYSDELLAEFGLGAYIKLSTARQLQYLVYKGIDRSVDNTDGNQPVIFSQNFDNLLSSKYQSDMSNLKTFTLIGGEGEGLERFCVTYMPKHVQGINRREIFTDARSSSRKYDDSNGTEQYLSESEYTKQLKSEGSHNLTDRQITESFKGDVDISRSMSQYGFGKDFYIGDIATVQDTEIGLYINARILKARETMDDTGYSVTVEFGL